MPQEAKTAGADPVSKGQRAGNLIFGDPEPRPATGPRFEDVLAGIDKNVAEGKSPLEGLQPPDPNAQAPLDFGRVEEPAPGTEPPPEGEPATDGEGGEKPAGEEPQLPEGWSRTETGKLKRPDGTFADKAQIEAIRAGQEPPANAAAPAEGDGDGEGEGEGEGEGAGEEGAPDPNLLITLAGHEERGEEDVEIQVEDAAVAERLRRLQNDALRGSEARRQQEAVAAQRDELDYVLDNLRLDAPGFVMDHVTKPEVRRDLALDLLTDPDVFKAVMDEYGEIADDEAALDAKRTKRELLRLKRRDETRTHLDGEAERRRVLREINDTITTFAGELEEGQKTTFTRIAYREIADHVRENKLKAVDPAEVPLILHKRGALQLFGLTPTSGNRNGSRTDGAGPTGASPKAEPAAAPPAEGAAVNGKKPPVNARKVGEGFKRARERREDVAAVAPAGVGASPSRLTPPKGLGVKESLDWLEQQVGRR